MDTHLITAIAFFISLLTFNTACNRNQHSHMLPITSPQKQTIHTQDDTKQNCPICLETLQNSKEKVKTLTKCRHTFHQTCILYAMEYQYTLNQTYYNINIHHQILKQLQTHLTCPLCRQTIQDKDLLYYPQLIKYMFIPIVYYGKIQEFYKILDHINDINQIKYPTGESLLHLVVLAHNMHSNLVQNDQLFIDMAKALIQKNINIHSKDYHGATPLYMAIEDNNTAMIKFLLKHNTNVHITDKRSRTT